MFRKLEDNVRAFELAYKKTSLGDSWEVDVVWDVCWGCWMGRIHSRDPKEPLSY